MAETVTKKRVITWRGGDHEFCLSAEADILSLEEKCGFGIAAIHTRLLADQWGLNDVVWPIRLGLTGAGMSVEKAAALVKTDVIGNPNGLAPSVVLAIAITGDVIYGVRDDTEKE